MTYAVPEETCHGWRNSYPNATAAEIARRDGHPFGARTVRKHINGNCSHPAPSVDSGTCLLWRRWYARPGGDPERHDWTVAEIRRRYSVLDVERIERHLDLECEHADDLGFPPWLPRAYHMDDVQRLQDAVDRDDAPISLEDAHEIVGRPD